MDEYDVVVLGAGAGGLAAASDAKERGARVALISDDRPGGDCSYYGCVPTKTLVRSAKILHLLRRSTDFGLPPIDVTPDFSSVMAHVNYVVDDIAAKGSWEPWEERGFRVYRGEGKFLSAHEIQVNGATVLGDKCVLAVGTRPAVPPVDGLAQAGFITNVEAVALNSLPRRLAVLGGGPIGVEFAQLFARFGSDVTVLERDGQILPKEDSELADLLETYLKEEGVRVYTGADVSLVEKDGDAKALTVATPDGEFRVEADELLVATGRDPATDSIGLDRAGVDTDEGWVKVDDTLRTTAPNIFGVGDCTGEFLFTHVADYQAGIAVHNLFASEGDLRRVDYDVLPWVTFTDPELARVGLTEGQAKEKGMNPAVSRLEMSDVERARMIGETKGRMKVVADEDGRILGATVLAAHGDDLIHEFALAMSAGLKAGDIHSMIHAYPTLAESVAASVAELIDDSGG